MKDLNKSTQDSNYQMKMSDKFSGEYVHERLRYDEYTGKLYWKTAFHKSRIGMEAGGIDYQNEHRGYYRLRVNLDGRQTFAHHIVWFLNYGYWPQDTGLVIDHIDGDGLNNRLSNLRLVDYSTNAKNMSLTSLSKSGVPGVTWVADRSKWRVRIKVDGVKKSLGSFTSFEDAVAVRKNAERAYGFHENHGRVTSIQ